MDARDVDLTVTRRRRPRSADSAARTAEATKVARRVSREYPTRGSEALAPQEVLTPPEEAAPPYGAVPQKPSPSTADTGNATRRLSRLAVAPPPPVSVPRTPFVVLVLLVVVGGVLGVLLLNTKVNENAFILHDLRAEQAALDQRQQQLERQIAQAESPGQLAAAARNLGLVQAEEMAYLRLPSGEVVSDPVAADGEPSRTSDGAAGIGQTGAGESNVGGSSEDGAGTDGASTGEAGTGEAGTDGHGAGGAGQERSGVEESEG